MKNIHKEFNNYAHKHLGVSSLKIHNYYNNYITPNIIEERQMNVAIMSVYDRLLMDRLLFLNGPVTSDYMNILIAQLLFLESVDAKKDISILISSPGGSVNAGFALINTMEFISCDVSTTVVGIAASMGSAILASGTKGKRFGLKNSRVMIHQISSGNEGSLKDLEISLKETLRVKQELYEELSKCTGKTFEQIEHDCDRDYWMTTQEAINYGLMDKIISNKSNINKNKK